MRYTAYSLYIIIIITIIIIIILPTYIDLIIFSTIHRSLKIFSLNIFQLLYIADNPALRLITYIFFHCLYYVSTYTWLYMHAVLLSRKFTTLPFIYHYYYYYYLPRDDRILFCSRICSKLNNNYPQTCNKKKKIKDQQNLLKNATKQKPCKLQESECDWKKIFSFCCQYDTRMTNHPRIDKSLPTPSDSTCTYVQ